MNTQNENEILPIVNPQRSDVEMLCTLQAETFKYFIKEADPVTGLVADKTQPGAPSSIAAVGMAFSSYIIAVERNLMTKDMAIERTLKVLRFLLSAKQGVEPDATGYKGFYYHFLDMSTGKRAWGCELSTIDTAILMAGALSAMQYFAGTDEKEVEIRAIVDELYHRIDWQWALNDGTTITHGWTPESGFLPYRWDSGYSEAHILYVLALGSPTYPIAPIGYKLWTETFSWKKIYDTDCIYAGPLFIHQMSHIWIDFKGIHDDANRKHGIDYFENSRRATHVQQLYALDNPFGYKHYGEHGWGFTASDGPGPTTLLIDGIERVFHDYIARGVPFGPDDGTISPWAVVASLPFAPEIVLKTIRHAIEKLSLKTYSDYGFDASFNATYPEKGVNPNGWISPWQFGLNQGPIIIMIENFQTRQIWDLMRQCPYLVSGLRAAGFEGGWLDRYK
jgi:hypothetical protein